MLDWTFGLLKRNWLLFALFILISSAIGYFRASSLGSVYEAESMAVYKYGKKEAYKELTIKLNALIMQGNEQQLATLLNIDGRAATSLIKIEATNILGNPLKEDLTENSTFKIKLFVNDIQFLDTLETAIVYYYDSPDYIQERLVFNDIEARRNISELKSEINQLGKDRSSVLQSSANKEALNSIAEAIEKARLELHESKLQLRFNKNIELLDGFIIAKPAIEYKASRKAMVYGFAGLALAFLVAMLRDGIQNRIKKQGEKTKSRCRIHFRNSLIRCGRSWDNHSCVAISNHGFNG